MKHLALALLLCSLSSINAMQSFTLRNSTPNTIIVGKDSSSPAHQLALKAGEQKELKLPCGSELAVESTLSTIFDLFTTVDGNTKLMDVTAEKAEPGTTYIKDNQTFSTRLIANKRTTRPLIILKKIIAPLLVREKNDALFFCKEISCYDHSVATDISADTQELEIRTAQPDQQYPANTPIERIRLVPDRYAQPILVKLARNATGLEIAYSPDARPFKITQFKQIEIEEGN